MLLGQTLENNLFQNVNIKNQVLQLEIAPEYKNADFLIGFVKNGKVIANTEFTSTQNDIVDLRQLDLPDNIDFIATTLPEEAILGKEIVKPSFGQELTILFSKNFITLRSINLVNPKTLFGYRYTLVVLLFTLFGFLILRFGLKQSWLKAALISSIVGFIGVDLTTMNDHWNSVQDVEKKYPTTMPVFTSTNEFIEKAKPIIGQSKCIIIDNMPDSFQPLIMKYQLADIDYKLRKKSKKLPPGTFIITSQAPKSNQKMMLSIQGINLLQKQ